MRGSDLNWRLAVKGSQTALRSLGENVVMSACEVSWAYSTPARFEKSASDASSVDLRGLYAHE